MLYYGDLLLVVLYVLKIVAIFNKFNKSGNNYYIVMYNGNEFSHINEGGKDF